MADLPYFNTLTDATGACYSTHVSEPIKLSFFGSISQSTSVIIAFLIHYLWCLLIRCFKWCFAYWRSKLFLFFRLIFLFCKVYLWCSSHSWYRFTFMLFLLFVRLIHHLRLGFTLRFGEQIAFFPSSQVRKLYFFSRRVMTSSLNSGKCCWWLLYCPFHRFSSLFITVIINNSDWSFKVRICFILWIVCWNEYLQTRSRRWKILRASWWNTATRAHRCWPLFGVRFSNFLKFIVFRPWLSWLSRCFWSPVRLCSASL